MAETAPEFSSREFPPELQPVPRAVSELPQELFPAWILPKSSPLGSADFDTLQVLWNFSVCGSSGIFWDFPHPVWVALALQAWGSQTHLAALIAALMNRDPALTGVWRSLLSQQTLGWIFQTGSGSRRSL